MPTATYIALGTITLTGNEADIEFSSIPATYRDLVIIANEKNTTGTAGFRVYLNGDTGNANSINIDGSSGGATSGTNAFMNVGVDTNEWSTQIIHIMDYSATDKQKTILARGNAAGGFVRASVGRWASTSAVTSVVVTTAAYDFVTGSQFSLYGIVS